MNTHQKILKVHKIVLVDASGSMASYTDETKKAIKNIIQNMNPNHHLTLVYFDSANYFIAAKGLVSKIKSKIANLYSPNASTPITDSVYKAIQDITMRNSGIEYLSAKYEFIIFTDGEENSSHYVSADKLGAAIEHFTKIFNWKFQFIGPKSCEKGINQYVQSIKIEKENVTLYADVTDGLKTMCRLATA